MQKTLVCFVLFLMRERVGGIDKYFKEFPDGGYWKGKNYVFDKRFTHAPIEKEKINHISSSQTTQVNEKEKEQQTDVMVEPMSHCEACHKPWDMYRGKRRCPTCGVPSLICKDCYQLDSNGIKKLNYKVRCDLCIEQNIYSKKQLNEKIQNDIISYEQECKKRGILEPQNVTNNGSSTTNNNKHTQQVDSSNLNNNNANITRLLIRNMCRKKMTEEILMKHVPGITHIVLKRRHPPSNELTGQGWVEMKDAKAASDLVSQSGILIILGRPIYVEYQPPNPKDIWPPPHHAVFY
jgi:Rhodanase C-terminal